MNAITRIILRGVLSGNVPLTSRVIDALREVSQNHARAETPIQPSKESSTHLDGPHGKTSVTDKPLSLEHSPPGRWIHKAGCVMVCALVLGTGLVHAAHNTGQFETANAAFAEGKYSEAAHGYEAVIEEQGYSAAVLFNLANAQLREGRPGQSILNYERAALLAPGDPEIAANLRLARQKAGVAAAPRSRLESVAPWLTLNGWFCFAAVAAFLIAATLPLKQLWPGMKSALNWSSLPAAFALTVAVMVLVNDVSDLDRAIVITPEATAAVSPVSRAQPVFLLRAGEVVLLKQQHGAFVLIENHAGQKGWVRAGDVTRVIPAPSETAAPRS